ncbi:serine O-acetyltransferase [Fulvivirgaceae bacterium BMA10]|uniref:Serine acetyltransferase n=1 Tax=Splendidivirga corallicola TaxID=3051826 RepID=A0ABT8KQT5_9BACT|nr:serine O-acetyltransferase [Fulvivirgaceae bacterium BMA10]
MMDLWNKIRTEATGIWKEPMMAGTVEAFVLDHATFEDALLYLLSYKLQDENTSQLEIMEELEKVAGQYPIIFKYALEDLETSFRRDYAQKRYADVLLFSNGFVAIQSQRFAHWYFNNGKVATAKFIQSSVLKNFGIDIHPGACLGKGLVFDHGTGIVIGETSVIEDGVFMFHNVTLGGTGKGDGDRHPKIGKNVLIGAGATLLGNIHIGEGANIAAGAMVLKDVPEGKTVAGVPAKIVGEAGQVQ